jgi:hypothetical protein
VSRVMDRPAWKPTHRPPHARQRVELYLIDMHDRIFLGEARRAEPPEFVELGMAARQSLEPPGRLAADRDRQIPCTAGRLPRPHVTAMVTHVSRGTSGRCLPPAVTQPAESTRRDGGSTR